ncbi:MAG: aminotransferase class I/II-fold pyridoxal phosphate-dependent enzyme [Marinilabiliales bacterium]|nr:aminotransferase class I/II-fold pyridoxal phosphate-dependent enzyme [Marinilabiliales bacterium]
MPPPPHHGHETLHRPPRGGPAEVGHPRLFRDRVEDEGRDLARHRRAGLRHAVAHPRGRDLRPREGEDPLHLQPRPDRAAPRDLPLRGEKLSASPTARRTRCSSTVGVSEALDLAFRALINPGDKVLFHQPCYVSYHPSVVLTHGVGIPVPTFARDNFALTAEALAAAWEPGCKVLMLNLPCNPTGGTCNRAQIEAIARFAAEKDLLVISDEIYSELTFEGEHVSIASMPGHAGAHDLPARILQGLRDDRLAHRLRLRAGRPDRGDDEGAPILDDVRLDHQPGGRARGARARRGRHEGDARAIPSPPRLSRAPLQRDRPRAPPAARLVLHRSPASARTGLSEKDFALGLAAGRARRSGARHRLRREWRGFRARVLCDRLRTTHRGHHAHRALRRIAEEVARRGWWEASTGCRARPGLSYSLPATRRSLLVFHATHRRHRRPTQRRQEPPLQPAGAPAHLHRARHARRHA